MSAAGRGYGSAWQKARRRYLVAHHLCVESMKEGKYVKATDVDHIVPHRGGKKLFWNESNWQALCSSTTASRRGERTTTRRIGIDAAHLAKLGFIVLQNIHIFYLSVFKSCPCSIDNLLL